MTEALPAALPRLPDGWLWVRLGEVADVRLGKMLSPKAYEPGLHQLPYLRNENVRWFTIDTSDVKAMGFTESELQKFQLRSGDLLVCEGGEPGRCAVVTEATEHYMYQKALHRVRPLAASLNPLLLQYCFRHFISHGSVFERRSETTIQHLPREKMVRLYVPLPPKGEQDRIVAEIEKQFSRLDAGVAALKRVEANLRRYKASVLKAACEGRLTAAWRAAHPDVEPASELLKRILRDRRRRWEEAELAKMVARGRAPKDDRWRERYEEPAEPRREGLTTLPARWCWASVDQLSFVVRGASPRPAGDPRYFGGAVPWITVGPITADEEVYLRSVPETLTDAGREVSRVIEPHTLLLTNSGATLGVPKISLLRGCINDGVAAMLDVDYPLKLYLYHFLRTQTHALRGVNQGAAQPNLNTALIRAIRIPLPPELEQAAILEIIESALTATRAAEHAASTNLRRARSLRQSVLREAFEGKLVEQDPKDEAASMLLERIRAEHLPPPSRQQPACRRRRPATGAENIHE